MNNDKPYENDYFGTFYREDFDKCSDVQLPLRADPARGRPMKEAIVGATVVEVKQGEEGNAPEIFYSSEKSEIAKEEEEGPQYKVSIPTVMRWFYMLPIIAFKLAIALFLLAYAQDLIMSAGDNVTVVANCVALGFIFEVDDQAYNAFTPRAIKALLVWDDFIIEFNPKEESETGDDGDKDQAGAGKCTTRMHEAADWLSTHWNMYANHIIDTIGVLCGSLIVCGIIAGIIYREFNVTCNLFNETKYLEKVSVDPNIIDTCSYS